MRTSPFCIPQFLQSSKGFYSWLIILEREMSWAGSSEVMEGLVGLGLCLCSRASATEVIQVSGMVSGAVAQRSSACLVFIKF